MTSQKQIPPMVSALGLMLALATLLFWIPVAGPATAGILGGRRAGSALTALIVAQLPAAVVASLLLLSVPLMESVPLLAPFATMHPAKLVFLGVVPLAFGAVAGGLAARTALPPPVNSRIVALSIGGALILSVPAAYQIRALSNDPDHAFHMRRRGNDRFTGMVVSQMQSDLKNLATGMEAYFADSGRYSARVIDSASTWFRASPSVRIAFVYVTQRSWAAIARNDRTSDACWMSYDVTGVTDGSVRCGGVAPILTAPTLPPLPPPVDEQLAPGTYQWFVFANGYTGALDISIAGDTVTGTVLNDRIEGRTERRLIRFHRTGESNQDWTMCVRDRGARVIGTLVHPDQGTFEWWGVREGAPSDGRPAGPGCPAPR